ncbi:MAG: DUF58 domain-containing protein, partial [Pirellulales bacterium]|nr:DUF58 domain-containing protein [Pirellulales bacterium]
LEFGIRFESAPHGRRGGKRPDQAVCESLSPPQSISLIQPAQRIDIRLSICFDRRGVHCLPNLVVVSMFPFYLFRSVGKISTDTLIAITPKPLTGDEDNLSREMLATLGGWSHKLLAGDALDYTGSREYHAGMPVRRWDFASWARLGRPIVREFQSPSVQSVTLVIDTAMDEKLSSGDGDELLERLLSIAATAIVKLAAQQIRVRLYVTDEDPSLVTSVEPTQGANTDSESLLIRLAGTQRAGAEQADQNAQLVLEHVSRSPALVISARPEAGVWESLRSNVTFLRVDLPHGRADPPSGHVRAPASQNRQREPVAAGEP